MSITPEQLFQTNLPVIEGVIRLVAAQHRLSADERDDFASEVRLRLIDHDYAVLRRFEGRSSLRTFLVTVISRQFLDLRDRAWGKWRPSKEAKRQGPVAELLERLMVRDGHPFDEAVAILQTNHQVSESRDDLSAILQKLPHRLPRRFVGEQVLDDLPADGTSESGVMAREEAALRQRVGQTIADALKRLPAEDAAMFQLRHVNGMTIAEIARLKRLEQKPLYRRLEKIRQDLETTLKASGINSSIGFGDPPDDQENDDGGEGA